MDKSELRKLLKKYPYLRNIISIGYRDGCICISYSILKRKYYVYGADRNLRTKLKEFKNSDQAYNYLWELFGGYSMLERIIKKDSKFVKAGGKYDGQI